MLVNKGTLANKEVNPDQVSEHLPRKWIPAVLVNINKQRSESQPSKWTFTKEKVNSSGV